MTHKSVTEVYQLHDLRAGFPHAIMPTDVIAVDDDPTYRLVLSYDYLGLGRLDYGFMRRDPPCTHINLTLLEGPGKPPICIAFSAKCLVDKYHPGNDLSDPGKFAPLHNDPLSQMEREMFKKLKKPDNITIVGMPVFRTTFTGANIDESDRICEGFQSIKLVERQFAVAKEALGEWMEMQKRYGLNRKNCQTMVDFVLGTGLDAMLKKSVGTYRGRADIPLRPFSNSIHYPKWDQLQIEGKCQGEIKTFSTGWVVQPSAVSREMAKQAYGKLHAEEMDRHDEQMARIAFARAAAAQKHTSALAALNR